MKQMIWGLLCLVIWTGCQPDAESTDSDGTLTAAGDTLTKVPDTPEALVRAISLQIKASPKDYSLYEERAIQYYQLDSLEASLTDIEKAISLYREGPDLHYWRGFLAFTQDDTAQARTSYQTAVGLGSRNPEAHYQLGQIDFLQERYARALDNYKGAAKIAPADPQYVFAQGFLEAHRGRYDEAATLYQVSLRIDSTHDKTLAQLHDLYLNHYENEEVAMRYNAQLLRNHPGHALGRFQEANYYLREALNIMGMNQLSAFENYVNQAVSSYSIALNRDPNLAQAWYNRGYCYFLGNGRESEAIYDFKQTISLNPSNAPAHFMIGSIFEKNGDLRTALDRYEKALSLDPGSKDYRKAVKELKAQLNG